MKVPDLYGPTTRDGLELLAELTGESHDTRVLLSGSGEGENGTCEEGEHEADVVLFTFFMLLLGLFVANFLRKLPIPYTALLLITGLVFGFAHKRLTTGQVGDESLSIEEIKFEDGYERLGIGLQIWTGIGPELLLLIFLPSLIFASAFSLDFHIVKRVFGQVLTLAGPGVIIGTGLIALFARYGLPYDWCWPKCLLFGAMLSATDPVAVVALLKEVGASAKLGHVIEGESLFNDGTAFVFFLLFRDMIPATDSCLREDGNKFEPECPMEKRRSFGESVEFFSKLALGGPAVGIMCGLFATLWIKFVFNDLLVEISLTFVSAYLTFYLAEDVWGVSGVLAVVALGIFMGTFARDRVSSRVHEPMHVFWEMMEYFANTMIFIYTGVKVAIEINEQQDVISGADWGWAVLLYIVLNAVRALTVVILYPILSRMGYGLTMKDAIVMVWGGLRGAVGLALALIVELDYRNLPPNFRALVIFHMGLMAVATLIINGTTMPYLLKLLGTTTTSPEKLEVLLHVVKELEDTDLSKVEQDLMLGDADENTVKSIVQLKLDKIIPRKKEVCRVMTGAAETQNPALVALNETFNPGRAVSLANELGDDGQLGTIEEVPHVALPIPGSPNGQGKKQKKRPSFKELFRKQTFSNLPVVVTEEMLVMDLRSRLLQGVKTAYAEWLEHGYIGAEQMFDLKESTDKTLDKLDRPVCDWRYVEKVANVQTWRAYIQKFAFTQFIAQFLHRILFEGLEHAVMLSRTFIHAHQEAEHHLTEYLENSTVDFEEDGDESVANLKKAVDKVLEESIGQRERAEEYLKKIRRAYPEITRSIKTKMVAQHLLLDKSAYVSKLEGAGLIEAREAGELKFLIEKRIKKLAFHPPHLRLPDPKDLLHSHPLFAVLNRSVFDKEVIPHAKSRAFSANSEIFSVGSIPRHITIVIRGVVRILIPDGKTQRQEGTGAILGMSEVLLNQPRGRTLVADTVVEVYQIEADVLRELVARHQPLRRRAWQMAAGFLTMFHPWGEFRDMSFEQIQAHFRHAELLEYVKDENIKSQGCAFLALGMVVEVKIDGTSLGTLAAPSALALDPTTYVCLSEQVKILRIPGRSKTSRFVRRSVAPLSKAITRTSPTLARLSLGARSMQPFSATRTGSEPPNRRSLDLIPEHAGTIGSPFSHPPNLSATSQPLKSESDSESESVAWRLGDSTQSADFNLRRQMELRNRSESGKF
ncbi:hypothetical protein BSKO_11074 [Bryopsis sp. KO-2023]|nr:hypothetical protein BSKO_11074 [Bryopsis sp. KO-2023]